MIRKTEKNLITVSFESIHEAVEFLKNTRRTSFYQSYHPSDEKGADRAKFTGTESFDEAMELLLHGWNQGAETLNKRLTTANKNADSIQMARTVYDVAGYQACVPRYLQGIPTNMINRRVVMQKQKTVNVVRDIGYNAGVSSKTMLERGLETLNVVNALEKRGIRCNLYVSCVLREGSGKAPVNIQVRVKSSSQRMNIKQIAFPLAHPSFFRRIVFGLIERLDETRKFGYGYGICTSYRETKQCFRGQYYLHRDIVINYDDLDKHYIK